MFAWSISSVGNFSVSSTHKDCCNLESTPNWVGWVALWKVKVQQEVRVFIWLLAHDIILTNYADAKCK